MNTYANSRLIIWSEWLLKKDLGSQGFPKQCIYTKLVQIRGGVGYSPDFEDEATIVDKFMTKLRKDDWTLFEIISQCYCIKWVQVNNKIYKAQHTSLSTQACVAERFGYSQRTISEKLNKVQNMLIDFMHDVELAR